MIDRQLRVAGRAAVLALHGFAASSDWLARPWLLFWSTLLRAMPRSRLKASLIWSVEQVRWPDMVFRPVWVEPTSGCRYRVIPRTHGLLFRALFDEQLGYEPEVFAALHPTLGDYQAIVEIGANVGIYTCMFAAATHDCRIIALEPANVPYRALLENLAINRASNVLAFNLAVAPQAGWLGFYEPKGHETNGSARRDFAQLFDPDVAEQTKYGISGLELSELLEGVDRVLVKIDVEGFEAEVLESLRAWLEQVDATLVLEVLEIDCAALNGIEWLRRLYDLHQVHPDGLLRVEGFRSDPAYRDYLLKPRPRA